MKRWKKKKKSNRLHFNSTKINVCISNNINIMFIMLFVKPTLHNLLSLSVSLITVHRHEKSYISLPSQNSFSHTSQTAVSLPAAWGNLGRKIVFEQLLWRPTFFFFCSAIVMVTYSWAFLIEVYSYRNTCIVTSPFSVRTYTSETLLKTVCIFYKDNCSMWM